MRRDQRRENGLLSPWRKQLEDLGERGLEIGDRLGAGVEGAERIDEHDLPVEPREVVAEEGADHDLLVGLEAALEHRVERGRGGRGLRAPAAARR